MRVAVSRTPAGHSGGILKGLIVSRLGRVVSRTGRDVSRGMRSESKGTGRMLSRVVGRCGRVARGIGAAPGTTTTPGEAVTGRDVVSNGRRIVSGYGVAGGGCRGGGEPSGGKPNDVSTVAPGMGGTP